MLALTFRTDEILFHESSNSIVKNGMSNFFEKFTISTISTASTSKEKLRKLIKTTKQDTLQVYSIERPMTAVFEIADIERAINSGFIEVPVIEDFDEFKNWFNSLK